MPRVEEAIVIDRPPEEVFAYVTTPENDREWVSTAVERQREGEGPIGVGSRIRAVDRFLGRRIESMLEVTAHEPNTRSEIRLEGPIRLGGAICSSPQMAGRASGGCWTPRLVSAGSTSAG